jgi:U3 small nucleolar ribonucleoprotein component
MERQLGLRRSVTGSRESHVAKAGSLVDLPLEQARPTPHQNNVHSPIDNATKLPSREDASLSNSLFSVLVAFEIRHSFTASTQQSRRNGKTRYQNNLAMSRATLSAEAKAAMRANLEIERRSELNQTIEKPFNDHNSGLTKRETS